MGSIGPLAIHPRRYINNINADKILEHKFVGTRTSKRNSFLDWNLLRIYFHTYQRLLFLRNILYKCLHKVIFYLHKHVKIELEQTKTNNINLLRVFLFSINNIYAIILTYFDEKIYVNFLTYFKKIWAVILNYFDEKIKPDCNSSELICLKFSFIPYWISVTWNHQQLLSVWFNEMQSFHEWLITW